MATYKFHYFDGRGRAEVSRLILTAAGQKFEDIRYSEDDWPKHKASMPLSQIPVLEYEGILLPQSMSIARFLARQFNLAGKDNLEQAQVEAVADTAIDLLNKVGPIIWYQQEPEKTAALKQFFANDLPKHLQNLETLAKAYSNGGSFFVGNHLTMADLCVYDVLENIVQNDSNALDKYSWLTSNRRQIAQEPTIAEYLKKRSPTAF